MSRPLRVTAVCSGNICRSPIAEYVLRSALEDAGLGHAVVVDSVVDAGATVHAGARIERSVILAGAVVDVGVGITIREPGVYGRIEIGSRPPPPVRSMKSMSACAPAARKARWPVCRSLRRHSWRMARLCT